MPFYFCTDTKVKKKSALDSKTGLIGFITSLAAIIVPIVMMKIMPFLGLGERGGWIDLPSAGEVYFVLCVFIIYLVLLISGIRYSRRGLHGLRYRKFAIAGLIIPLLMPIILWLIKDYSVPKNSFTCRIISDEGRREFCYLDAAVDRRNLSICDKIKFQARKNECYFLCWHRT